MSRISTAYVRRRTDGAPPGGNNRRINALRHPVKKEISMSAETEMKVKYGAWGLILGAGGAMIIGFNWGGWITGSKSLATTEAAVLSTRAAICVAQFAKGPKYQERLKELKATNSWERSAVIEKGGWDRMPGEAKAVPTVGRACADGLDALPEKS